MRGGFVGVGGVSRRVAAATARTSEYAPAFEYFRHPFEPDATRPDPSAIVGLRFESEAVNRFEIDDLRLLMR